MSFQSNIYHLLLFVIIFSDNIALMLFNRKDSNLSYHLIRFSRAVANYPRCFYSKSAFNKKLTWLFDWFALLLLSMLVWIIKF